MYVASTAARCSLIFYTHRQNRLNILHALHKKEPATQSMRLALLIYKVTKCNLLEHETGINHSHKLATLGAVPVAGAGAVLVTTVEQVHKGSVQTSVDVLVLPCW